jgi:hypothetical protein
MIKIKKDALRFSFPSVAQDVERMVEDYTTRLLPTLLAEDRETVIEQFLDANHALCSSPEYQEKVRTTVTGLNEEDIEKMLRKHVKKQATSLGYNQPGGVEIEFERTLRIPDDGKTYHLPPSLGRFPLRHVEDYSERVPLEWKQRGGVLMPMYQAEALWLYFQCRYPFAIKIGAGKINAVSGESWKSGLSRDPQDYVVTPDQPWLDGFVVEKGVIRQFVAMALGAGYSIEEQLSGKGEFGGIQLQAIPMKAQSFFEKELLPELPKRLADILEELLPPWRTESGIDCCRCCESPAMGLGAGGRMKQEIYADPYDLEDWDTDQTSRVFVHLCDALLWRDITGENPPQTPLTVREYERAGFPWFDYYRDDLAVLEGSKTLAGAKSVQTISQQKGDQAVKGNQSVEEGLVINLGPKEKMVKEWV